MAVHRVYLKAFDLNYVRATEPFMLCDLYSKALEDIANEMPLSILSSPMVLDLRAIDLLRFDAEDFRRLLRCRQAIGEGVPSGPCALLARDVGSFGMLRMYAIFADLSGFRSEEQTIVTTDLDEALRWLNPLLKAPAADLEKLREALEIGLQSNPIFS